eukprot:m.11921 g.11921  ORF g.11921 m.11921 type:complete len:346 (-) comp3192_c0_seq2:52-1089(-)
MEQLQGAAVLEKDTNEDVLWAWIHPAVSPSLRLVVERKCGLGARATAAVRIFSQFRGIWFYIVTCPVSELPDAELSQVEGISVVVWSKEFNPEQHLALADALLHAYVQGGNGARVMELYVQAMVRGAFKGFRSADYPIQKAYLHTSIRNVIGAFGVEAILLYAAVLLKRRIVVHGPDTQELVAFVRTLPQLVISRKDWSIAFPIVDGLDDELAELAKRKHYIAGVTSATIESREDLFDIFVNLSSRAITVATHAKDDFTMGKVHKDIAMAMVAGAEADTSDEDILKDLAVRTQGLIDGLKGLANPGEEASGDVRVTLDDIKARKMPPAMHTFLFNLACAENLAAF